MENNVQILDCTLRDGGQGLEDNVKHQIGSACFEFNDIELISSKLAKADIDIIELGCIEISPIDKKRFSIYQTIEEISKKKPAQHKKNQLFVGLYTGPDTPVSNIPEWDSNMVDGVRVILRYSELKKSLNFCAALSAKGYKVFVQPMLTMRYTEDELKYLVDESNTMGAYALYFVDSYGYMREPDIDRLYNIYNEQLNPEIRIGFHSHNNLDLAFSNVLHFLDIAGTRRIIVDSTCIGMGQGAGNMQTEVLAGYFNTEKSGNYDYGQILDICEIVEKYSCSSPWGYSVPRMLSALHKTAYKYSISLRNHYCMCYRDINEVFLKMPENLRHRYTPENIKELLIKTGYSDIAKQRSLE